MNLFRKELDMIRGILSSDQKLYNNNNCFVYQAKCGVLIESGNQVLMNKINLSESGVRLKTNRHGASTHIPHSHSIS